MKNNTNSKYFYENHISVLAFSSSGEFCAIGIRKTSTVRIYKVNTFNDIQSWNLLQEFKEHTQTISDIDWAHDDKILTSSHDRSVFVWRKHEGKWHKMICCLVGIQLSALSAKWAPNGKKFAIGSSCSKLTIGYYNQEQKSWMGVSIKQAQSPITTVSFHPSSNLVAIGSTDFSIKIVTCSFKKYNKIKKQDIAQAESSNYNGQFKDIDSIHQVLFKVDSLEGWINYVSFDKSGASLLVLPHNSHFKVYQVRDNNNNISAKQIDCQSESLPFVQGFIADNGSIFLGGYDRKVTIYNRGQQSYKFSHKLEKNQKSNMSGNKKGLVSSFKTGIQKKSSLYNDSPDQSQHFNTCNVLESNKRIVSYDINGIIHFWE